MALTCSSTPTQVLLGITLSWLICYILTVCEVLPSDPDVYGHLARTDLKGDIVSQAPWLTFPYPGRKHHRHTHTSSSNILAKSSEQIQVPMCAIHMDAVDGDLNSEY